MFLKSLKCIITEGVLVCLDGYMNIALEQTEEYVNGQLKNKYGDAFIRGNNGNILIQNLINILYITLNAKLCSFIHKHTKEKSITSFIFLK
jgi:small nuclear ribonucleoprotein (snRNP)-like protein